MIDVLTENLLSLKQATHIPALMRDGRRPALSAVYRWAMRGATATNGSRVRLETVKTPSGTQTSEEAIVRFIATLTNPDAEPAKLTTKQQRKLLQDSETELAAIGVK